jgi:hypothetical protein
MRLACIVIPASRIHSSRSRAPAGSALGRRGPGCLCEGREAGDRVESLINLWGSIEPIPFQPSTSPKPYLPCQTAPRRMARARPESTSSVRGTDKIGVDAGTWTTPSAARTDSAGSRGHRVSGKADGFCGAGKYEGKEASEQHGMVPDGRRGSVSAERKFSILIRA